MKIENLNAAPYNPRKISAKQLEMLKKSIDQFGDLSGFIFNETTGRLVSGHQRCKVLPKDSQIVISKKYQEPTDKGTVAIGHVMIDQEMFPYRAVKWDEITEKAANLAANKHGGEFDMSILPDLLLELDQANIDMDLTGFDLDELEKIMAPISSGPVEGEDEAPEVPKETNIVLGDIFILGDHRLMCGDSTSIDSVEKLINGEKMDMVFTDPPYGMNLKTNYARTNRVKGKTYQKIIGDDKDFDPSIYFEYFKNTEEQFWWGADYYCEFIPKGGAWTVWDKKKDDIDESIGTGFELCWSKKPHKRMLARFLWTGFTAKERNETRSHPAQKPIALHQWFFERWGKSRDNIIDLFGGSGSILIACEKTNRKCFMMEIDPYYCSVILDRWEKFSGKKAHHENGQSWQEMKSING